MILIDIGGWRSRTSPTLTSSSGDLWIALNLFMLAVAMARSERAGSGHCFRVPADGGRRTRVGVRAGRRDCRGAVDLARYTRHPASVSVDVVAHRSCQRHADLCRRVWILAARDVRPAVDAEWSHRRLV